MKIALFTDTYLPEVNGVAMTIDRWRRYMNAFGVKTLIIAPQYDEERNDAGGEEKIIRVPSIPFLLYPDCRLSLPNYLHLSKALSDFRPDLVHITTPFPIGLTGRKLAKDRGLPLVFSYHTNFDQYLNHYGLQGLSGYFWQFMQWFHKPASAIYAPSTYTKKVLQVKGLDAVKIWNRGVDVDAFNPLFREEKFRRRWGAEGKKVLIYVGRLAAEKNIQALFSAYNNLSPEIKKDTVLVLVGDGPAAAEIKALAPAGAIFTGMLKGKELSAAYASGDIFVFASESETFGNVILEAMASGLPVVAAGSGGVLDNLKHKKNGLVFTPGKTDEMTAHLHDLLRSEVLRKALSKGAREYALGLSWVKVMQNLYKSYKNIIEDFRRAKKVIA